MASEFIGLVFKETNLNVDLTHDIFTFTDSVNHQAHNARMLREGMNIEARYVCRKQLHQYISGSLLKRERTTSGNKRTTSGNKRKALDLTTVMPAPKKTKLLSEYSPAVDRMHS